MKFLWVFVITGFVHEQFAMLLFGIVAILATRSRLR